MYSGTTGLVLVPHLPVDPLELSQVDSEKVLGRYVRKIPERQNRVQFYRTRTGSVQNLIQSFRSNIHRRPGVGTQGSGPVLFDLTTFIEEDEFHVQHKRLKSQTLKLNFMDLSF